MQRNLRWLEAGFYLGGVALLAVFFFLRFEGERQREAGIEAFQLATDSLVGQAQASEMQLALTGYARDSAAMPGAVHDLIGSVGVACIVGCCVFMRAPLAGPATRSPLK